MAGNYLLDTNIFVAFNAGESSVVNRVATETVFLSAVVLGELYFGAFNAGRRDENVKKVDVLSARIPAIAIDAGIARRYGEVKVGLKRRGKPIPENDIWIAATALHYDLILATRDAHFDEIDGLRREKW
jgi:tRNA(fMet)-specific endonuclease VapC